MTDVTIKQIDPCHLAEYGEIYAAAFSGEPWYDPWKVDDATVHVKELIECPQSYGLECLVDGEVAGFLLGTSMLFHYGRTFEINDLAVAPKHQRKGIADRLLDKALADLKQQGIAGVHLITAAEGDLQCFYGKYGFEKEKRVVLMGREI